MAANPLTYTELEAFERKALVRLSAWQADLIMRLDDAVLAVWNEKARKATDRNEPTTELPVTDVSGLKAMFKATAERKRMEAQAREQAKQQRRRK